MKIENSDVDLFDDKWLERLNMDTKYGCSGDGINIGEFLITAISSLHDISEDSLNYIISYKDKYRTDLLRLSDNAWRILKTYYLDLVILDHTYGEGFNAGGHLDAGQVINIIECMRKEQIIDDRFLLYETHISHEGNDTHDIMEEFAIRNRYKIAYDRLKINI